MTENMLDVLYSKPADKEFIIALIARARKEHELPNQGAFWDYVQGIVAECVSYTDSWVHLGIFHYIFYVEKNMRQCFSESLDPGKRDFFTEQWEPYLLEQTQRLSDAVHEDARHAMQLYSDSLREAWQWQHVEHPDKPPPEPKLKKMDKKSISHRADWGIDAWQDVAQLWTDMTKKECTQLVTKKIIKEKLLKDENFTYFWFIHEGYAGEGIVIELLVPPTDTGIILSWYRKTQTGDTPKKSIEWFPLTNIGRCIFGK